MEKKLVGKNTLLDLTTGKFDINNAQISKSKIIIENEGTLGKDMYIAAGKLVDN